MSLRSFLVVVMLVGLPAIGAAVAMGVDASVFPMVAADAQFTISIRQCAELCERTSVWVWRPDRCECEP